MTDAPDRARTFDADLAAAVAGWLPEHALVCDLARSSGRQVPTIASRAAATPDWEILLRAARYHGISEQIAAAVAATATVPPHVVQMLHEREFQLCGANLRYVHQLAEIIDRLRDHGIRALAFRGPVFAASYFGHVSRRAFSDLDILVEPRTALRVRPLLIAAGYRQPLRRHHRSLAVYYGLRSGVSRVDTLLPSDHQFAPVEVHVAFSYWTQGIRHDHNAIFARAEEVEVAGLRLPTLGAEDLLLALAVHGMQHGWAALRYVRDIDAVAPRVRDWDAAVSLAAAARMRRMLNVALLLAHGLLGTDIPQQVLTSALDDGKAVDITRAVVGRLFDPVATWKRFPWFMSFQDSRAGRWRYAARAWTHDLFLKWAVG